MKKSDNAYYDVDEFIKKHYDGTYSTILRLNKQGAYNAQVLDELNLVIDTFLNGKLIESVVLGNTFMQSTQEGYVMRWFDYQLLKPHAKYIIAPKDDDMYVFQSMLFSDKDRLEEWKITLEEEMQTEFQIFDLYDFFRKKLIKSNETV